MTAADHRHCSQLLQGLSGFSLLEVLLAIASLMLLVSLVLNSVDLTPKIDAVEAFYTRVNNTVTLLKDLPELPTHTDSLAVLPAEMQTGASIQVDTDGSIWLTYSAPGSPFISSRVASLCFVQDEKLHVFLGMMSWMVANVAQSIEQPDDLTPVGDPRVSQGGLVLQSFRGTSLKNGDGLYSFNGTAWSRIWTTVPSKIEITSGGAIVGLTPDGKLNVSTNLGASWEEVNHASLLSVSDISAGPDGRVYAAPAIAFAPIYATGDNGASWVQVTSATNSLLNGVFGVPNTIRRILVYPYHKVDGTTSIRIVAEITGAPGGWTCTPHMYDFDLQTYTWDWLTLTQADPGVISFRPHIGFSDQDNTIIVSCYLSIQDNYAIKAAERGLLGNIIGLSFYELQGYHLTNDLNTNWYISNFSQLPDKSIIVFSWVPVPRIVRLVKADGVPPVASVLFNSIPISNNTARLSTKIISLPDSSPMVMSENSVPVVFRQRAWVQAFQGLL